MLKYYDNNNTTIAADLFGSLAIKTLTKNFMEVLRYIVAGYESSDLGEAHLANVLGCKVTTINNWLHGRTSPHNRKSPNQSIYNRIDLLRNVYGNEFDHILQRNNDITINDDNIPDGVKKYVPSDYLCAWGYFTSAIKGTARKYYDIDTIKNWANKRKWSKYLTYEEFESHCKAIMEYLDTWFPS